jgi:fatty-acid desaturase
MNVTLNQVLSVLLGLICAGALGLLFPQILLGVIVGFLIMWFLRPSLEHLFNYRPFEKPNHWDVSYVKGMKTRINNLEKEVREMKKKRTG